MANCVICQRELTGEHVPGPSHYLRWLRKHNIAQVLGWTMAVKCPHCGGYLGVKGGTLRSMAVVAPGTIISIYTPPMIGAMLLAVSTVAFAWVLLTSPKAAVRRNGDRGFYRLSNDAIKSQRKSGSLPIGIGE